MAGAKPQSKLSIPASFRASGGRDSQTVVHDLSISGFSTASMNRMHEGQKCWLSLPDLDKLEAEVVRWENSIVHCEFNELLSPIVHDTMLLRYSNTSMVRTAI
ncbi:MAG: PilZ domain-containing protein [Pseudomonadota bacterium]